MGNKCTKCKKDIGTYFQGKWKYLVNGKQYCFKCADKIKKQTHCTLCKKELSGLFGNLGLHHNEKYCGKCLVKIREQEEKELKEIEESKKKSKEITTGYRIQCTNCEYEWDTREAKIPAICPACHKSVHYSGKYNILVRYIQPDPPKNPCCCAPAIMIILLMLLLLVI